MERRPLEWALELEADPIRNRKPLARQIQSLPSNNPAGMLELNVCVFHHIERYPPSKDAIHPKKTRDSRKSMTMQESPNTLSLPKSVPGREQ